MREKKPSKYIRHEEVFATGGRVVSDEEFEILQKMKWPEEKSGSVCNEVLLVNEFPTQPNFKVREEQMMKFENEKKITEVSILKIPKDIDIPYIHEIMEKLQDIDIRYIHGIMEKLQENKYSEKEKVPLSKKHIIGEDGPFIVGEYGPGENGPELIKLEINKEPFDPSKTKISLEMKQKLSNIKRPEGFENLKMVKKIRCEEENKNG